MAFFCAAKRGEVGLPLNNHRKGNQQQKKDGRQYLERYPLTRAEFGIWHMTAFGFRRERKALSHRFNSQGARGDINHIGIDCRIARRIVIVFGATPPQAL